jgi:hypothetical protein
MNQPPNRKFLDAAITPDDFSRTAVPLLQHLNYQTTLLGRYRAEDKPTVNFLWSQGATRRLHQIDGCGFLVTGPEDTQAVKPSVVLPRPNPWSPTRGEGAYLSTSPAVATLICTSEDREYSEFLIDTTAAIGRPCFRFARGEADCQAADVGRVHLAVPYAALSSGGGAAVQLARKLLVSTGAASVVVVGAPGGFYGVQREPGAAVLQAPVVPVADPIRTDGSDAAFFAGYVAEFLRAPAANRLERALHIGRLVATRHIVGAPVGGWYALNLFEKQLDQPMPAIRRVA